MHCGKAAQCRWLPASTFDIERERAELEADDKGEHKELTAIYVGRGLDHALPKPVTDQLMARDALGAQRMRRASWRS
ncbi:MAG TPA: hypothetical protein VND80_07610 [Steroidobacteraceae bacterium]|nr:hypothetical protein [Steroidobacteraceae bacterium]